MLFVFVVGHKQNVWTTAVKGKIVTNLKYCDMKNLVMLFVALLLSSTLLFAQSNSPLEKGKYFGKELVKCLVEDGDREALDAKLEKYTDKYLVTEEDVEKFLEGLMLGIYKACEENGLPEEVASMIIDMLMEADVEAAAAAGF